ncbi:hypothetical protein GOD35_15090 [Sinorhizobium medicae]|nr:hypothetical protein [Sinorhizobium medicae]MDX0633571.1 hypothetical protein [Sinorhizobium medicae]
MRWLWRNEVNSPRPCGERPRIVIVVKGRSFEAAKRHPSQNNEFMYVPQLGFKQGAGPSGRRINLIVQPV